MEFCVIFWRWFSCVDDVLFVWRWSACVEVLVWRCVVCKKDGGLGGFK